MQSDSTIMILVLGVLIMLSAFFSATETAFSSASKIRLKHYINNGNRRAALALALCEQYDELLSTILIGNNIVNIGASSLATVLFVKYFPVSGVAISTLVMTVLVLVFGEVSPKSLAKESPERFAMFVAPIVNALMGFLKPINWLFMQWKKLLSRLVHSTHTATITEEELMVIIDEIENDGVLDKQESDLLRSVIEFDDLDAQDVITPRVDVVAAPADASVEQIRHIFQENGFSRLPIYEDDMDKIIGVVHEKDFYNVVCAQNLTTIATIIKEAVFVTQSMRISALLKKLQQTKSHMAIVIDEFGGTVGIVTLEDVIEQLVGDIYDEHDEEESEFTKLADGRYLIDSTARVDELFELFSLELPNEFDFTSVNSFVVNQLGKIPQAGDCFVYECMQVTVTKTDEKRLLEIMVEKSISKSG